MPERIRPIIANARTALRAGQYDAAIAGYFDAAEVARKIGLQGELAYALKHGALSALEIDQSSRALKAAEEAAAIYDRLEPVQGLNYANSQRIIALASERLGRREESERAWVKARGIYVIHGVDEGVAECDAHLSAKP